MSSLLDVYIHIEYSKACIYIRVVTVCPQSPLGHIFSVDYVPDPIGAYVLCRRCTRSIAGPLSYGKKNHANAALIKFPLSNQKIGGLGHQTVLTLNLIITLTSLYHVKQLKKDDSVAFTLMY